ncbi:hypothetical protein PGT21_030986 [Puccinia graminis f. sp. tritici]|uniref:Uncharacterized protein n=1 Tax=Puccinia graminis f. sp. tritici TaxID=56615 RepID=A0A5B0Q3W3_PUCGR|nr:hypothetical protein PGT21_030986 [Puccinia graminis f. sp. tritici]KAA1107965.1 hypothetical protein PGTUg99_017739 [Puccinia graminis f. sp. tritici]
MMTLSKKFLWYIALRMLADSRLAQSIPTEKLDTGLREVRRAGNCPSDSIDHILWPGEKELRSQGFGWKEANSQPHSKRKAEIDRMESRTKQISEKIRAFKSKYLATESDESHPTSSELPDGSRIERTIFNLESVHDYLSSKCRRKFHKSSQGSPDTALPLDNFNEEEDYPLAEIHDGSPLPEGERVVAKVLYGPNRSSIFNNLWGDLMEQLPSQKVSNQHQSEFESDLLEIMSLLGNYMTVYQLKSTDFFRKNNIVRSLKPKELSKVIYLLALSKGYIMEDFRSYLESRKAGKQNFIQNIATSFNDLDPEFLMTSKSLEPYRKEIEALEKNDKDLLVYNCRKGLLDRLIRQQEQLRRLVQQRTEFVVRRPTREVKRNDLRSQGA